MLYVREGELEAAEFDPGAQRWIDRLLSIAVVEPSMMESEVGDVLGPDRETLAFGLLQLWNWLPTVDDDGADRFPHLPPDRLLDRLGACASFYKMPAHVILRDWSFPEFSFNWRVALASAQHVHDEVTRRIGVQRG